AAVLFWRIEAGADQWTGELVFAAVCHALVIAYAVLHAASGALPKRQIEPHLAAVLSSVATFFLARQAWLDGGHAGTIGVLPVAQALLMALLLWQVLRLEPASERWDGRLALVAGTSLAFVTAAIPLQLDKQWITIGWALQAAALAWLFGKVPHRGLLWWTAGLCVAVFVRLVLNPAVLEYHPRGDVRI